MDSKEVLRYVEAFADGELDVEQNLRVLEHMAMNPTATRRVLHQQQLRQAVERVIRQDTPPTPANLRASIAALAAETPAASSPAAARPTVRQSRWELFARIGAWTPVGLAAALLALTLILQVNYKNLDAPSGMEYIPTSKVAEFGKRHVTCSRQLMELHEATNVPQRIEEIPHAVAEYLGTQPYPVLDLTKLGYEFEGVGKCTVPGDRSVHLVYRSMERTGYRDTVSLWIQPDGGQLGALPQGVLYRPRDNAQQEHPMVYWRTGGMIYYLIGDDPTVVEQAANMLRKG
jgi:anti-sigma factor RsiW